VVIVAAARTHYETLGVPRTATPRQITAAYRRLVRRAHPDAGGSDAWFREVDGAYRVLRDPPRRAAYDRTLTPPRQTRRPGGPGGPGPVRRRGADTGPSRSADQSPAPATGQDPHPNPDAPPEPDREPPLDEEPAAFAARRRRYLLIMAVALTLFVLAGAVVRLVSVPAALAMAAVAATLPPAAAILTNRPPR
jgi:curved DNA-binding protein CbpA